MDATVNAIEAERRWFTANDPILGAVWAFDEAQARPLAPAATVAALLPLWPAITEHTVTYARWRHRIGFEPRARDACARCEDFREGGGVCWRCRLKGEA